MTHLEARAMQIANEIHQEAMDIKVCNLCGKILMYSVNIGGRTVCEWCADAAWEQMRLDHQENEDRRRAAQNGTL